MVRVEARLFGEYESMDAADDNAAASPDDRSDAFHQALGPGSKVLDLLSLRTVRHGIFSARPVMALDPADGRVVFANAAGAACLGAPEAISFSRFRHDGLAEALGSQPGETPLRAFRFEADSEAGEDTPPFMASVTAVPVPADLFPGGLYVIEGLRDDKAAPYEQDTAQTLVEAISDAMRLPNDNAGDHGDAFHAALCQRDGTILAFQGAGAALSSALLSPHFDETLSRLNGGDALDFNADGHVFRGRIFRVPLPHVLRAAHGMAENEPDGYLVVGIMTEATQDAPAQEAVSETPAEAMAAEPEPVAEPPESPEIKKIRLPHRFIIETDAHGEITFASRSAAGLFEPDDGLPTGRTLEELLAIDDLDGQISLGEALAGEAMISQVAVSLPLVDGRLAETVLSARPVVKAGKFLGHRGVALITALAGEPAAVTAQDEADREDASPDMAEPDTENKETDTSSITPDDHAEMSDTVVQNPEDGANMAFDGAFDEAFDGAEPHVNADAPTTEVEPSDDATIMVEGDDAESTLSDAAPAEDASDDISNVVPLHPRAPRPPEAEQGPEEEAEAEAPDSADMLDPDARRAFDTIGESIETAIRAEEAEDDDEADNADEFETSAPDTPDTLDTEQPFTPDIAGLTDMVDMVDMADHEVLTRAAFDSDGDAPEDDEALDLEQPALNAEALSGLAISTDTSAPDDNAEADDSAYAGDDKDALDEYAAVLERLPLGVLIFRGEELLKGNRAFFDLLDYSDLNQLAAMGGLEAIFPSRAFIDTAMREAAPGRQALSARRRDGDLVDVIARLQALPWGGETSMMLTLREAPQQDLIEDLEIDEHLDSPDATQRVPELENHIDELTGVIDIAMDGVVIINADRTIQRLNASAEALFGTTSLKTHGEPFTALFAPESVKEVEGYLDNLTQNGIRAVLNDGLEVHGRVAGETGALPLFMTIGRLGTDADARLCAVLRDIGAWKKTEGELRGARKKAEDESAHKTDFIAHVSHEIRTPLNSIIGFAEIIKDEQLGPIGNDRYKEYVGDIQNGAQHILALVNDLLDLSKIEAGKLDLDFGAVNLNDVMQQSATVLQPEANRDKVIIRTSLPAHVPPVVADEKSLRQIILNVLSNAVKYTRPGGQVIASTRIEDNGEVTLTIRDTGVGMDEDELAEALEPFRRVKATSADQAGSGLGLPLTRALVSANRAVFNITSRKDIGTTVKVVFPVTRVLAE